MVAERRTATTRKPREGTNREVVLALLRCDQGIITAQVIEPTGWRSHMVRGVLAGLKRKGIAVEVLEHIRQVGPTSDGAKGSCSIYVVA